MCRFHFLHIILPYRKVFHFCDPLFIGCGRAYQLIFFIIIFTDTIRRLDIFCSIDFKGDFT
ncbi:hypothetical protein EVA_04625 [gut metagenome]|uniref:Uncharacterized protein n=1 Tax=gut metagenome TaxID=749906 RepID=J9GJ61_9ZZZZ